VVVLEVKGHYAAAAPRQNTQPPQPINIPKFSSHSGGGITEKGPRGCENCSDPLELAERQYHQNSQILEYDMNR